MTGEPTLLEQVQGLLERTYRMRTALDDIGRFVVGDAGYRWLYSRASLVTRSLHAPSQGARTLVRETRDGVRACIYLPDALIRDLENHPPQRGLNDSNVAAFATLVEELDHLLCIAERAQESRPITFFELELHANVSKHLVLARFLAGRGRPLDPGRRSWLHQRLYDSVRFREEDPSILERYEDAIRWTIHFLSALDGRRPAERVRILRSFHAASAAGKIELIERLERGSAPAGGG